MASSKRRFSASNGIDQRKQVVHILASAQAKACSDIRATEQLLDHAFDIARALANHEMRLVARMIAGMCAATYGDRALANKRFTTALSEATKLGDIDAVLELRAAIASVKITTGHEQKTLAELHQILRERTETAYQVPTHSGHEQPKAFFLPRSWEDRLLRIQPKPMHVEQQQRRQLASLYDAIGLAYIVVREHHKAASFLEEELAIYRSLSDERGIATATNHLGYIHALLGNNVLALEYCHQGLKLARQLRDQRGIAINQRNLAQLYMMTGPASKGKRFAMQSFENAHAIGMNELACRPLVLLTKYERLHGSLAKAASLNQKALKLLEDQSGSGPALFFSVQQILVDHAKQPSNRTYQKLRALHRIAKAKGLELQYEIAQEIARVTEELHLLPDAVKWFKAVQEYEIERLNSEQRSALVSLQTEQQLERLARERELQRLQMERLELELGMKARETEQLAVHLAKKGSVLASLLEQLQHMRTSKREYSSETIDAVVQLIESIRYKDKEYEHLEARASAFHHQFVVAIEAQYPDLTSTEKRICILLKLGLTTIDVANVLFTSVRTIEAHALSIRKKLRIPASTRLSKFLIEFAV